jgi:hypothetical protein
MYQPEPPPQSLDDLLRYVASELDRIGAAFSTPEFPYLKLQKHYSAPAKPEVGVYFADGTQWNPGAGQGLYFYDGSTYTKL